MIGWSSGPSARFKSPIAIGRNLLLENRNDGHTHGQLQSSRIGAAAVGWLVGWWFSQWWSTIARSSGHGRSTVYTVFTAGRYSDRRGDLLFTVAGGEGAGGIRDGYFGGTGWMEEG